jgi:hypothetical protein
VSSSSILNSVLPSCSRVAAPAHTHCGAGELRLPAHSANFAYGIGAGTAAPGSAAENATASGSEGEGADQGSEFVGAPGDEDEIGTKPATGGSGSGTAAQSARSEALGWLHVRVHNRDAKAPAEEQQVYSFSYALAAALPQGSRHSWPYCVAFFRSARFLMLCCVRCAARAEEPGGGWAIPVMR